VISSTASAVLKQKMKFLKPISFVCFQLISLTSFSQITLDYSNFISVGDSIVEHFDSLPDERIQPGEEGANKTWDFTYLETDFTDTLSIVSIDKTLFAEKFSPSDIALCLASSDSVSIFYNTADNHLKCVGSGYFLNGEKIINKEERRILKYPLNYLDEDSQAFKKEKILHKDSLKILTTTEHEYKVDAWGDLKLSTGIFFSLRVKRSITVTESYYKYTGWKWEKYQEEVFPNTTYEWWTDDPKAKHYIAYIIMKNGKPFHASFIPAIPFEEKIEKIQSATITVYPNPTQNFINIDILENENYVNIYSMTGQLIYSEIHTSGKVQINASSFSNGTYVLIVRGLDGKILGKSKFIKT